MNYFFSEKKKLLVELAWHGWASGLFGFIALICLYLYLC